jgi:hypothetical protein
MLTLRNMFPLEHISLLTSTEQKMGKNARVIVDKNAYSDLLHVNENVGLLDVDQMCDEC